MTDPRLLRELLLDVPGPVEHVASGSGLEVVGRHAVVVADDLHHLALFDLADHEAPGRLVRTFPGELPAEHAARKARKPDIEAIALLPSADGAGAVLVGLPSGSRPNRTRGFVFDLDERAEFRAVEPRRLDAAPLLEELQRRIDGECNLEGAASLGDELVLAVRGVAGANALARLDLAAAVAAIAGGRLEPAGLRWVEPLELGDLDGVAFGITDLAVVDGELLCTAAAEDTDNAYDDGEVVGSAVAWLTLGATAPRRMLPLPRRVGKVEGVAADGAGDLLLVTDDDDPGRPARMYLLADPGSRAGSCAVT